MLTLFGNKRLVVDRIVHRARPVLCAISHQARLAAYVGSLDGIQVIVEDRVLHSRDSHAAHAVGEHLDGHAHSLGKALLALRPKREILAAYGSAAMRNHTKNSIRNKEELLSELRDVAAEGYAIDDEELVIGTRSVAVALINPMGRATCAIALEGPRHKLNEKGIAKLAPLLKQAAASIMQGIQ